MLTEDALKIIDNFKNDTTGRKEIKYLQNKLIGKSKQDLPDFNLIYDAALEVKRVSCRINEIVHAAGIIKALPFILTKDETIESLSLGAGTAGNRFDLVTNKRVAEFKFAQWHDNAANGVRKRAVIADYINLFLLQSDKKKELYVFGAEKIEHMLRSEKSACRKVLSKSGLLLNKFNSYLIDAKIEATYLNDIFKLGTVTIIELNTLFAGNQ